MHSKSSGGFLVVCDILHNLTHKIESSDMFRQFYLHLKVFTKMSHWSSLMGTKFNKM